MGFDVLLVLKGMPSGQIWKVRKKNVSLSAAVVPRLDNEARPENRSLHPRKSTREGGRRREEGRDSLHKCIQD